jgi:hypothetical protein
MAERCLGVFWFIDLEESESTIIVVAVDLWLSLSLFRAELLSQLQRAVRAELPRYQLYLCILCTFSYQAVRALSSIFQAGRTPRLSAVTLVRASPQRAVRHAYQQVTRAGR